MKRKNMWLGVGVFGVKPWKHYYCKRKVKTMAEILEEEKNRMLDVANQTTKKG